MSNNKNKPSFKANIRLKDIIGQGLINNSNIAIIELIKNARDAKSKDVKVIFTNAGTKSPNSQIVIQDSGSGMDLDDIVDKWLNIAYSDKRNNSKGMFAGDKGIGRFSCDRLGTKLNLYSKKSNTKVVHLHVNWEDFEVDDRDKEISSVKLDPKYISQDDFFKKTNLSAFKKGTCLIIENLREAWTESELEQLKKELERFIIDPEKEFEVSFKSNDFEDKNGDLIFDGVIENKLLAKLDEKTISVHSQIIDNGKTIRTELHHYGDKILSFEEDNPYTKLKNIKAQVHYLSQGAKTSFKVITGYKSYEYGSIMFYLNGFRVMPYGEPKDDWLQLNQRKAQGTMRFLGTRDLFGIVEAYDYERNLAPVTSREGMENNLAFNQLTDKKLSRQDSAYLPGVLNILEKYVVDGIDWDRVKPKDDHFSVEEIKNAIQKVLESHKKNKKLRNIKINYKKISQIAEQKTEEYETFVTNLMASVSDKSIYELTPSEKQDVKKYVARHDATTKKQTETNREYKKDLTVEKKRRLFAESHLTSDTQRVRNLQHLIGILNGELCDDLEDVLRAESSKSPLSREDILELIKKSFFTSSKVRTLSQIITKANFDMMSETIRHNIYEYIEQYIKDIRKNGATWGIKVKFENPSSSDLPINLSPLEVSMLVDNIFSNASKAEAENLTVKASTSNKVFCLEFISDGNKLNDKFRPEDYFNAGITTTKSGAGIGLSHVKQIVNDLDGNVSIASNNNSGVTLKIWWDK
ncbi:MAG: hypothetical protein COA71_03800 [SAR86 cluster bacterium]|uniref:Histidine kinase domain-containing protein n=1 Tax=SAR86 cluster bacterium TaxID=2030880 RepID=A0A2A5CGP7_9GAMM|nr:sensor histidine kinase [Gammaproteobacteria bacterium AH-315-E17]PCJ42640.1 MAG: hypothetical protein COA71_03800 [SAR86 cluster bacterium]